MRLAHQLIRHTRPAGCIALTHIKIALFQTPTMTSETESFGFVVFSHPKENEMVPLSLKAILGFSCVMTLSVYCLPSQALPRYSITDMGTLGGSSSVATSLNNSADVVGTSFTRNDTELQPFLYRNGVMSTPVGLPRSFQLRINDLGQITGYYPQGSFDFVHAFLYRDGVANDLGTLRGSFSSGRGLNNFGQVVGQSAITGDAASRAFLYSGGVMTELGTLGGTYSDATDINDAGQVVGQSSVPGEGAVRAFLLINGTMQDIGTLGGTHSIAYGINNVGQVIGADYTPNINNNPTDRAFFYSQGVMTNLGTLGGDLATPSGINDNGQVVGSSTVRPGDFSGHAFLYSDGVMVDLNLLVPVQESGWEVLTNADAINNLGQIAGNGTINGVNQAFLLTPEIAVPEPPMLFFFLAGVLGILLPEKVALMEWTHPS